MPAGRPLKKGVSTKIKTLSIAAKLRALAFAMYSSLQLNRVLDLDEWADIYRVLPSETSSEYGRWETSRFPFLRRIMKCMSPSSIAREIVVMKGAQLGFTELGICWILYSAHCHPGPMGYVQRTDTDVEAFSKQKLKPSIDACGAVYHTLGNGRPRGYSNTITSKTYPGGFVMLGPANSTGFLKSKSWGKVFIDEEDEYALNVNQQGSPRMLVKKRMVNFPGAKLVRGSTPVSEELSTIKPGFLEGSQEEYYVACPHCNPDADHDKFMFVIEWETIKWGKEKDPTTGNPVDVWCECPRCAGRIYEEEYKTWMLTTGDWFSTKNAADPNNPLPRHKVGDVSNPSFRISSFYSPLGFFSWHDAVADFHEYLRTRDPNLLQVFVNQTCAETFSLEGGDVDYSGIYGRREVYPPKGQNWDVPKEALCLTAGVDVQDDRFEIEVVGWGLNEESWSVDYKVIPGDTQIMGDERLMLPNGQPSVWRMLDEYLYKRFAHESGGDLPIEMTLIDSQGHRSEQTHLFCRPREGRRIFPCKGQSGFGNGYAKRMKRRHERYKTFYYIVYTDELKTRTYDMLTLSEPGPGYCHFPVRPEYDIQHFKYMTSERKETYMSGGRMKLRFVQKGRNEPLDCRNYAFAAFKSYPVDLKARAENGIPGDNNTAGKKRVIVRRHKVVHPGFDNPADIVMP